MRQEAVAFRQWLAASGLNRIETAACLGIAPRTLRAWESRLRALPETIAARGRPVHRSERAARTAVLEFLAGVGPGIGLSPLAGQFPDLSNAELADLLRRYRRIWVHRHAQLLHVLHWQQPGTVWAIDYARAPVPLEEGYTELLAVRDLASGMQLLWLPVREATAATTRAALTELFVVYGAPLVLKLDNGSPFVAETTQHLLAHWQVTPLYSPPGCPQYNGSIEAGIGALKVRTHYQAVRQGRPGEWTLADAEAAREQTNTLGRPWGAHGPTPAERWATRHTVTVRERDAFAATVARLEEESADLPAEGLQPAVPDEAVAAPASSTLVARDAAEEQACATCGAPAPESPAQVVGAPASAHPVVASGTERGNAEAHETARDRAARRRQAISRALVAHGYLLFTRRRIPPPIRRKKVT